MRIQFAISYFSHVNDECLTETHGLFFHLAQEHHECHSVALELTVEVTRVFTKYHSNKESSGRWLCSIY